MTLPTGSRFRFLTMKSSMVGTEAGRYIVDPIMRLLPASKRGSKVVGRPGTMLPISTNVPTPKHADALGTSSP